MGGCFLAVMVNPRKVGSVLAGGLVWRFVDWVLEMEFQSEWVQGRGMVYRWFQLLRDLHCPPGQRSPGL